MATPVTLRVKVPCADEAEFRARLEERLCRNGLRAPFDDRLAIGSRARLAIQFRDGDVLAGEAVVEEHVEVDSRPGVKVRILKLDRAAEPSPAARGTDAAEDPRGGAYGERAGAPATTTAEIAAAIARRARRFQGAAGAVAAAAALVALAGFAIHRCSGSPTPEAGAAAHLQAADRLLREGRVTGKDGALDHLLAARRLRPGDPATARQLDRVADLLERLASGALDRGDLAVAAIHLASARAAAPDRPSIRAKQKELDRRARVGGAR